MNNIATNNRPLSTQSQTCCVLAVVKPHDVLIALNHRASAPRRRTSFNDTRHTHRGRQSPCRRLETRHHQKKAALHQRSDVSLVDVEVQIRFLAQTLVQLHPATATSPLLQFCQVNFSVHPIVKMHAFASRRVHCPAIVALTQGEARLSVNAIPSS